MKKYEAERTQKAASLPELEQKVNAQRRIRRWALLCLESHKGLLRLRAFTGEKSAGKSTRAEIVNRLLEGQKHGKEKPVK